MDEWICMCVHEATRPTTGMHAPVAALVEAAEAASLGSPESKNRGVSKSSRGRGPLSVGGFGVFFGVVVGMLECA